MSDTRFAPVDAVERETAIRPAGGWRNWVWHPQETPYAEGIRGPGDVSSPREWPTKEVAETRWREWAARHPEFVRYYDLQYVGAFPDGERP